MTTPTRPDLQVLNDAPWASDADRTEALLPLLQARRLEDTEETPLKLGILAADSNGFFHLYDADFQAVAGFPATNALLLALDRAYELGYDAWEGTPAPRD